MREDIDPRNHTNETRNLLVILRVFRGSFLISTPILTTGQEGNELGRYQTLGPYNTD